MKVVIANNRFFLSGGPEAYMFRLMDELQKWGDTAIPFAVRYQQNLESKYDAYFVDPPSRDRSAIYYRELRLTPRGKARLALRSAYSVAARRALSRLIADEQPDVVYTLAIVNMLSPSLIDAGAKAAVPVVMRFSDFNFACPSYLHLRDGRVCRDCQVSRLNAIRYRCVQNSITASTTRVAAMAVHDLLKIYSRVSAFVTPSLTLRNELIAFGIPREKTHYIPTFIDIERFPYRPQRSGAIVYVGRLSHEKGVDVLIRAHAALDARTRPPLFIVGEGPARADLASEARSASDVTFFGHLEQNEVARLLATAYIVAAPSRWLENSPNTVYEAMASGKPVVASAIGSLMEQVSDGINGYTFPVGDYAALSVKLQHLIAMPDQAIAMGRYGREIIEREHSPTLHYRRLMQLFTDVTSIEATKHNGRQC